MMNFIIEYWLEVIFGVGISILGCCFKVLFNRLKALTKEWGIIKEAIIALLHDRLIQSGMYYIERGYIYASELERFTALYNGYHGLGGNGTGTEIYERVQDLDIRK